MSAGAGPIGVIRHVVVDRDGVLNREPADGWVHRLDQWRWEDGGHRMGIGEVDRRQPQRFGPQA